MQLLSGDEAGKQIQKLVFYSVSMVGCPRVLDTRHAFHVVVAAGEQWSLSVWGSFVSVGTLGFNVNS